MFGERTVIGGFNVCFNQRSFFIYKSFTDLKGMAIRKTSWQKLLSQFPFYKESLHTKFMNHYDR
jgi:hypothetical protein